jgi:ribosomal protein L37AE/L43A
LLFQLGYVRLEGLSWPVFLPSLVLHPDDPGWHPSQTASLWAALREQGLLASDCQPDVSVPCLAGERFFQFIMFLGCSPQVALTAEDAAAGAPPCTVCFNEFDTVRLVAAQRRQPARCPDCGREALIDEAVADQMYTCANCNKRVPMHRLDWRQAAGFGRFFIEVSGIYPHEAVPTDRLLQKLRDFSHCDWKYFFFTG